jgi:hypothetical protein
VLEQHVHAAAEVDGAARRQAPHGVAPLDVLDLDDLGPPLGEQRRRGRDERVLRHLQDPNALHDRRHRDPPHGAPDLTHPLDG